MADPNEVGGWVVDPKNPNRATYTDEYGDTYETFKPEAPAAPVERDASQRFTDTYEGAVQHGFAGLAARKWYDWTNYGIDQLRKQYPGQSEDWYESKADTLIGTAQADLQKEYDAKQAADPNWKPDESFLDAAMQPSKWGPWLAANIAGSAGPESFINPGGSALTRMGGQAAMGGLSEFGYQALEKIDEVRKEFDVNEMLGAAAFGAGLQGVFEVPGFIKGLFGQRGTDTTPGATPGEKNTTPMSGMELPQEVKDQWVYTLETGTYQDALAFLEAHPQMQVNKGDLAYYIQERDKGLAQEAAFVDGNQRAVDPDQPELPLGLPEEPRLDLQGGADNRKPATRPELTPTPEHRAKVVDEAVEHVNNITSKWTNAPEYEIHESFDDIPDVDPDAIAVVMPNGKVAVNMTNVSAEANARGMDPRDILTAATFHEGLGHHGLTQKFGDQLDDILENLYATSKKFQADVDKWREDNPDAYTEDANPLARAAEEVLAEMSEGGRISPTLMDKFKNWIKEVGRDMGFDIDVSDRELKAILGMAHSAVVNGKGRDVAGNGFRYMFLGEKASPTVKPEEDSPRWFTSADGKRRFEISDKNTEFLEDEFLGLLDAHNADPDVGMSLALNEILDHPELFDAYPDLADIRVLIEKDKGNRGSYDEYLDAIYLSPDATPAQRHSTLLHEVQHAIQGREDFARGGNTDVALSKMPTDHMAETLQNVLDFTHKKLLDDEIIADGLQEVAELPQFHAANDKYNTWKEAREKTDERRRWVKKNRGQDYPAYDDSEYAALDKIAMQKFREYDSSVRELEKAVGIDDLDESYLSETFRRKIADAVRDPKTADRFRRLVYADNLARTHDLKALAGRNRSEMTYALKRFRSTEYSVPYQAYQSLLGEVEARAVQDRQYFDDAQREDTAPYATQDEIAPPSSYVVHRWDDAPMTSADEAAPSEGTNRYMRKKSAGKGSEGPMQGGSRKQFEDMETDTNLGLGRFRSNRNIEGILAEGAPEPTKESWNDWIDEANGIRDKVKTAKNLKTGSDAPEVLAAREAIVKSANRIADLSRKAAEGKLSEREEYQLFAEMARNADMQDALAGVRSNAARIVNSFKISVNSDEAFADSIRNMMRRTDNAVLSDPANRQKLFQMVAEQADNPKAVNKLVKDSFKPKAEDFMFRVWYNMLLSSPATHAANFLGTGANFMYDLLENTGAAIAGQGKRFSNADRIRGREVAYRVWGALQAMKTANTWKNARESLNTGQVAGISPEKAGQTNVYTGDNKVAGAASGFLESPTRALAGADEWWRNVLQLSNIYGLAVRNAGNKGLKGKDFWNEVDKLIADPTKEMLDATNDYSKVLQFLDKPSAIGDSLVKLQTPKPDSSAAGRTARAVLKMAVPFVRTPDALIRTAIRRSGVLTPFERENIKGWKAGGAERDKVKARMIMGSALAFWVATQAYQGNITGQGPADYKKKQEWLGTHQENSIKVGDNWYSIQGLEPVSTNITGIATLVERLRNGEISQEDYGKSAAVLAHSIASVLSENSYLEGFNNLMETNDSDPNKAQNALTNFIANTASSAMTPAIVRSYTQSQDPLVRDTTGDGTLSDRIVNRVKSAFPGLSDTLPQKFDVYGRGQTKNIAGPDMASRIRERLPESDPVVQELGRLSDTTDKVIVGAPKKTGIKVNGEQKRLTAEEFQQYQQLSGYWIVESVRQEMQTPEWETYSDEEKIDIVKEIRDDMRANARDYLFDPDDEEPDTEELVSE